MRRLALSLLVLTAACSFRTRVQLPSPIQPLTPTPTAAFREAPPPPGTPRPASRPNVQQITLANGLTVLLHRARGSHVNISFVSRSLGARAAGDRNGLSAFMLRYLEEGSATGRGDQLARQTYERDISYSTAVSSEAGIVRTRCPRADVELGLDRLAELVLRPGFDPDAAEHVRLQYLNKLQALRMGDREHIARNLAVTRLFGKAHPIGLPAEGDYDTVAKLTRDDVFQFHRDHIDPRESAVVIVGDLTKEAAVALVTKAFGDWKAPQRPVAVLPVQPIPDPTGRQVAMVYWFGYHQSTVLVALRGPAMDSPDVAAYQLLKHLLGGQFVHSRLNQELRERHGVTYGVSANVESSPYGSTLLLLSEVEGGEEGRAVSGIVDQLRLLRETKLSEDDLSAAKAVLREAISIDSEHGLGGTLEDLFSARLPLDTTGKHLAQVDALTPEDVQRVAQKYLDGMGAKIVVSGDPRLALQSLVYWNFEDFDLFEMKH